MVLPISDRWTRPKLVQSVTGPIGAALDAVRDLILPESCPLCGIDLQIEAGTAIPCAACLAKVPAVERYCMRCSAPVGPHVETSKGCRHCRIDRFKFDGVFAASEYRDIMRDAVLSAKRRGGAPVAAWLCDRLWDRRAAELQQLETTLIVPVPQHWMRRVLAPHNSAELIARRLAKRLKVRCNPHILIKTRRTPRQALLTPSTRRTNLRSAFIATRPLHGCRILVVDDVLTTGTTADRAARALLEAGAEKVWVAVPLAESASDSEGRGWRLDVIRSS
jgi:competence protein ComFC